MVKSLGACLAVVLRFGGAAGAGFARVCRRPAWLVAEAARALAVAGRRRWGHVGGLVWVILPAAWVVVC